MQHISWGSQVTPMCCRVTSSPVCYLFPEPNIMTLPRSAPESACKAASLVLARTRTGSTNYSARRSTPRIFGLRGGRLPGVSHEHHRCPTHQRTPSEASGASSPFHKRGRPLRPSYSPKNLISRGGSCASFPDAPHHQFWNLRYHKCHRPRHMRPLRPLLLPR